MNRHFSTRWTRFHSLFWLVLLIFGCAVTTASDAQPYKPENFPHCPPNCPPPPQWSTTDLTSSKPLPSGTITSGLTNGVQWQVGNYWSDGLQIYGLICTPPASFGPSYPVAILNHGIGGAGNVFVGCTQMAQSGWLTAISAYRGEVLTAPGFIGLSQGSPDICDGDVHDVLNLLTIVTGMSNATQNQVFMWGHSEGSCITDLAIESGANVQIAVSLERPGRFL
jgi:dipeptidyl aminopeptidase/acylaminoacyl peptidase